MLGKHIVANAARGFESHPLRLPYSYGSEAHPLRRVFSHHAGHFSRMALPSRMDSAKVVITS